MFVPFKKDPVGFNQRKLMAENVFDLLGEDHDCFIYEDIFSTIDTSKIENKYSIRGQRAYHPRLITAILIYAYSQGIFSSRKIEKRCKEDLSFMYISHSNCPNFRVLSDFRKNNWQFFKSCFIQSVAIAKNLGMISFGHVSIDGSKFFANTSKHKAASYKRLKEAEQKLADEIEDLIKKADEEDTSEDEIYHNGKGYKIPQELKIKEKRLAKIKRAKKALEKREQKGNPFKPIKDSSQVSYADTEAKIMKTKGNFDYCYNGQISVDSKNQIILGQHLTQSENDKTELKNALIDMKKNTGLFPDKLSLDSGYISAQNISSLSDLNIDAYVAAGKGENDIFGQDSKKINKYYLNYDSARDELKCPLGHVLNLKFLGKHRVYRHDDKVCTCCKLQKKCVTKRGDRPTVYTDEKGIIIAKMKEKMQKNSSKEIYAKRKVIVEPVFGQIKTSGFRRFSLRGIEKTCGEFSLICVASNYKKIVAKLKMETNHNLENQIIPELS
jgi:transposase